MVKITKWGSYNEFISHSENEVWKFLPHFPFVSFRLYKQCLGKWTLKKRSRNFTCEQYILKIKWGYIHFILSDPQMKISLGVKAQGIILTRSLKLWIFIKIDGFYKNLGLWEYNRNSQLHNKKKKKIRLYSNIRIKFR